MKAFLARRSGMHGPAVALCACLCLCAPAAGGGERASDPAAYKAAAESLRVSGLRSEGAFELLRMITSVGPRLTGSAQAAAAVELARQMMDDMGMANVRMEPVTVGRWDRGAPEEARIVASGLRGTIPIAVCALGGSIGTPEMGLSAPAVEVKSFEELDRLGDRVKGKIVFYNRPMDRSLADPFAAYGGAADQRVRGAAEAARLGAVAVLVRSLTLRVDDHPHTGFITYRADVPEIPAAALSTAGADLLDGLLRREPAVTVFLRMNCRRLGPAPSANVMGEIPGSDRPGEIILVGGHLDSWDLATGAHDDGAGCAASLEALRLIRESGLRPKRTIRAVFFMDEEFGGTGGRFYADAPGRKGEHHLAAIESDRGGFLPLGVAAGGADGALLGKIRGWMPLLEPLGLTTLSRGGGGVDIAPLVGRGTVPVSILLNAQTYFDVHHSALDVLSSVNPRELELLAVSVATLAYLLAQEGP
jgi:carboxypeptidase Q